MYDANIRHVVEPAHHGRFIAVEPDSGDYVIHDQIVSAMLDMQAKRPRAYSHIIRIGYQATIIT